MENFLNRLARNPYAPIDGASVTRVDELGNGYDDFGQMIQPKFEAPEQTWGETALGVATAPARMATALAGSLSPYGQEGWQVPPIIDEGVNALTAVGDAYNYGMDQDEMRNRALGMASFMFAGGGPASALEKSLTQKPVTVRGYHGTRSEFDRFNGPSVYASENPDAASEWAMVANRDGEAPNVLPLDITASNPYYAKSLFPDQAELDRIAAADPDVVFYPPSTQYGTTFDKYPGQVFEARKPGTVRSATTGETLFSNADSKPALLASGLDMGQEARLARAEKRYDTSMPWYHGTRAGGFDEFDPSLANSSSKTGVPDGAIVFSSSPENASTYAAFREDMFGNPQYGDGAAVMPVYLDKSTLDMVVDAKGAGWRDIEYNGQFYDANELAQIAKDLEYEGLLVRNVIDSKISHGAKPADTYFKFSPQGIRSVNAAFDPSKKDSTNLLAANADSRPALLGAGQEQDIPDWLLPYLR